MTVVDCIVVEVDMSAVVLVEVVASEKVEALVVVAVVVAAVMLLEVVAFEYTVLVAEVDRVVGIPL